MTRHGYRGPRIWYFFAIIALSAAIWPMSAHAQLPSAQTPVASGQDQDRDDLTRRQLTSFDQFLDNHPELAAQIRQNPSLIDDEKYVADHPDLQRYLQDHPEIREDIERNPGAVMHQEERYDRREDADRDRRTHDRDHDINRSELANMDQFLDSHPEIAEQLRKDPSLADNKQFVQDHPALERFLADHPGVREEMRENPSAFMHREGQFDRREDRRDSDVKRWELANMDQFLDSHREIAEQLRKDPSLVNNKQFVDNHPALREFLENHPGVREEYQENPTAFMRQEERFDRREDAGMGRDRDVTRGELSSFNEFLENHNNIASQLSKNPSLATNQEYLANHPELQQYLKTNPRVNEELSENPQSFVQAAQAFGGTKTAPKPQTFEPKK